MFNAKVGFSTNNTIISRLIRWLTKATCSHTFLLVDFAAKQLVLEAADSGFRIIAYDQFLNSNTVTDLVEPKVNLDKAIEDAEEWLGKPYDYVGLFGFLWVLIGRALKRHWSNPLHGSKALFCSEVNTKIIQNAGWPGADKLDPTATSPYDLLLFMKGNL